VDESLHPFAYVVTSASPRAIETALAMGLAVDNASTCPPVTCQEWLITINSGAGRRPTATTPICYSGQPRSPRSPRRTESSRPRIVKTVSDGAAALVIGHGGGIESALVACLPHADHQSWGAPFAHCDGLASASRATDSSASNST
jgi:hypothetical protein